MCICTTKDGVKKLVEPMDELKRPSQLFSSTHYTKMVQTTQPMVYIVKPFSNSMSLVATAILVTGYTRGWRQCSITAVSMIQKRYVLRFQRSFLKIEKKFSEKLPYQFFVFGGFSTENPVWGPYFTPTLFCLSYIYCDVYLSFILYFKQLVICSRFIVSL